MLKLFFFQVFQSADRLVLDSFVYLWIPIVQFRLKLALDGSFIEGWFGCVKSLDTLLLPNHYASVKYTNEKDASQSISGSHKSLSRAASTMGCNNTARVLNGRDKVSYFFQRQIEYHRLMDFMDSLFLNKCF